MSAELRKSERALVLLSATLVADGTPTAVKLRNLSEKGALVSGNGLPPVGAMVTFNRKDLSIQSRVAWVHGEQAGIAFDRALNPREVLQHVSVTSGRAVVAGDFRRPGFRSRPLTAAENAVVEQWGNVSPRQRIAD